MPESEHSESESLPENESPKITMPGQSRSYQSLKTSSTSVEIQDPNDTFDANEKLSFDFKFFLRFIRIQKLLFERIGSLSSVLFVTVVLFTLLRKFALLDYELDELIN